MIVITSHGCFRDDVLQTASRKSKLVLAEQRELITRLETDIETVSLAPFPNRTHAFSGT